MISEQGGPGTMPICCINVLCSLMSGKVANFLSFFLPPISLRVAAWQYSVEIITERRFTLTLIYKNPCFTASRAEPIQRLFTLLDETNGSAPA